MKKRDVLEFLSVSGVLEALAETLEVTAHTDEGVTGREKERSSGADD